MVVATEASIGRPVVDAKRSAGLSGLPAAASATGRRHRVDILIQEELQAEMRTWTSSTATSSIA
jgi:hypothetical protein